MRSNTLPAVNDFKPGLEGVVAVETEIAEPDREGGSLRYRGIDIEELVGHYPYEAVWGLLVDDDLNSKMPSPEPYEPAALTGNAPADLQAETARLAGEWKLGKLNEISDEQAREDLGAALGGDDGDRRALGRQGGRPRSGARTTWSRRARRRPSASCCAGAARPTPGM